MNGRCLKLLSLVPMLSLLLVLAVAAQVKPVAPPTGKDCKDNGNCDRAQYCQKRAGKCAGPGKCVVRPQLCPEIYDPVCGCDNRTYSNACFAATVGVNVKHAGVCEGTCTTNAQCDKDQYCAKQTGKCGGPGLCMSRPQACLMIYDPVCGCDGKTYSNFCVAASAGENVKSLDECKK